MLLLLSLINMRLNNKKKNNNYNIINTSNTSNNSIDISIRISGGGNSKNIGGLTGRISYN